MGLFGLSIYAGGMLALALLAPERLHIYVSITAAHIIFGRAAGMSFGYAANLSNVTVITLAFIIAWAVVLGILFIEIDLYKPNRRIFHFRSHTIGG